MISSCKQIRVNNIAYNPLLHSKTGVYRGIHFFLILLKNIDTPLPLLYSKNGVYRGIRIFLIFAQNVDRGFTLDPPQ